MVRRFSVASDSDYGDEAIDSPLRRQQSNIAHFVHPTKEHHGAVSEYLRIRSWAASIVNAPETPPGSARLLTRADGGAQRPTHSQDQAQLCGVPDHIPSTSVQGVEQAAQPTQQIASNTENRSAPSLIRRKPLPQSASRAPQELDIGSTPISDPTKVSLHQEQMPTQTHRPRNRRPRPLHTKTRDAKQYSDEGLYLGIATLRGPTPEGLRELQKIMEKNVAETNGVDKGVRKINKLLRHERRGVIEWVDGWLRWTWGVRS